MVDTLPTCDVVVVTHERSAQVRSFLESLSGAAASWLGQVIVVDDSRTASVRAEDYPNLELFVDRVEHRISVSQARNRGIARVQAEFVYVSDDDNRVDRLTISHPLEKMDFRPKIAALMPSVLYARRPELVWVYSTPFRRGRWGFDLVGRNQARNSLWEGRLLATDALPNAALFRTDVFRSIGGNDERLAISCTADLCQRIKRAGYEAWADSGAFTYHDVELPGSLGSWAQHATDPIRLELDVHDWYLFLRRVHGDGPTFLPRALIRTATGNATLLLSWLFRRDARLIPLVGAMARGIRRGVSEPLYGGLATTLPDTIPQ